MDTICRWGILGTGRIARKFADAVARVPGNGIVAVASLTPGKAEAFAAELPGAAAYDSYEALARDPRVDAVYVANLHNQHPGAAMTALNAKKAVLCEKPMAVNAQEAARMIDCARANGVFLMEAMWSRFLPVTKAVLGHVRDGAIGEPLLARGAFSNPVPFDPASRLYDPAMAGGALLDIGVYLLAYLVAVFGGAPTEVRSRVSFAPSGVDDFFALGMTFPGGAQASVVCGTRTDIPGEMCLYGADGFLEIPQFWDAGHYILHRGDQKERVDLPYANGFVYEIEEVNRCLAAGLLESPVWPLANTMAVVGMMDALRREWGLAYPGE